MFEHSFRALRIRWPALLCLSATLAAAPTLAADLPVEDPAAAYAQCMTLTRQRPQDAFGAAVAWEGLGGGEPARHCAAVALFALGEYANAAERFEALAQGSRQGLPLRLDMLAQAGAAWLSAGRPARAEAVFDAALDLARRPEVESGAGAAGRLADLFIDRATARSDQGRDQAAAADLGEALRLRPDDLDALVLRATALRRMGALDAALADAGAVLARAPDHLGGLLEHGNIQRLRGDRAAARQSWMNLVSLAPDSPEAAVARENLARMDLSGAPIGGG